MAAHGYRDLDVWKMAMDVTEAVYRVTQAYPSDERYGLTSQTRRAAVSIPANIAEGHGRFHTKEYIHFIGIVRSSLKELETHLLIALRLGFAKDTDVDPILAQTDQIGRMLTGLRKSLEQNLSK